MRRTHPAVFPLFALGRIDWDVELEGEAFRVRPTTHRLQPYVVGAALLPAE